MKNDLETLGIKKSKHGFSSIDAEKMYPSIKFGMIKKAVDFFSKNLKKEEKETIAKCLDMIKFGMSTTFIQFKDQYWLYGGGLAVDEKV